jgi:hypothetical protein
MVTFRGSKTVLATFLFNRILVLFQNTSPCIINRVLGASTETGSSSFAGNNEKKKINVSLLLLAFKFTDDSTWLVYLRIACLDRFKSGLGHFCTWRLLWMLLVTHMRLVWWLDIKLHCALAILFLKYRLCDESHKPGAPVCRAAWAGACKTVHTQVGAREGAPERVVWAHILSSWILKWHRPTFFFCGASAQPGPRRPFLGFIDYIHLHRHTHTHTHIYPIGLLWTSDHPVAEAANNTTHNQHKRPTSMPSTGFRLSIPAVKLIQTYAVVHTESGIGTVLFTCLNSPKSGKNHTHVFTNEGARFSP